MELDPPFRMLFYCGHTSLQKVEKLLLFGDGFHVEQLCINASNVN